MKRLASMCILIAGLWSGAALAQQPTPASKPASEQPTTQTTSKSRQTGLKDRQRREQMIDRRPTREQPGRHRPDSLRRGGATSVDTLRR